MRGERRGAAVARRQLGRLAGAQQIQFPATPLTCCCPGHPAVAQAATSRRSHPGPHLSLPHSRETHPAVGCDYRGADQQGRQQQGEEQ